MIVSIRFCAVEKRRQEVIGMSGTKAIRKMKDVLLILISITLLPHLDLADLHLSLLLPSRIPRVSGIPEISARRWGSVHPWLATLSILEPSIGTTDSNVHDEVEFLIEWSLLAAGLGPDILETCSVGVGEWELTTLPEWLIEVGVEDLEETSVDVSEEILLGPLETEFVLGVGVGGVES
jgi:hypothetical protein